MKQHVMIPVWFFVGVLVDVYGVLILMSGLAEWSNPPSTVLAELHAPVWWGGVLVVIGTTYCAAFRPRRK